MKIEYRDFVAGGRLALIQSLKTILTLRASMAQLSTLLEQAEDEFQFGTVSDALKALEDAHYHQARVAGKLHAFAHGALSTAYYDTVYSRYPSERVMEDLNALETKARGE